MTQPCTENDPESYAGEPVDDGFDELAKRPADKPQWVEPAKHGVHPEATRIITPGVM